MATKSRWSTYDFSSLCEAYQNGSKLKTLARNANIPTNTLRRHLIRNHVTLRQHHIASINHDAFDNAEHDEAAAYWAGFLATDGCLNINTYSKHISLRLSAIDGHHVEEFKQFLKSSRKISIIPPATSVCNGKTIHSQSSAHLTVTSEKIFDTLVSYGITPQKSKTIKINRLDTNKHFWRGAVDGDGCIAISSSSRSPCLRFGTGSLRFVEQFRQFALTVGTSKASIYRTPSVFVCHINGHHAAQLLFHLYSGCTIALIRKLELAKQCVDSWPLPLTQIFKSGMAAGVALRQIRRGQPITS